MIKPPRFRLTYNSITRSILFFVSLACLSCSDSNTKSTPLVHQNTPSNAGEPKIKGMTDLGSRDILIGGGIPSHYTDNRFSPGEWVTLQGKNLGVHTLSIDNIPVEITQYYGNQPLFRIPTQLSPRKQHTLTVENRYGKTSTTFDSHHYIVTTDLDGGTTHLIRTNRKEKGGVEEEWLALPADTKKPIFNLITKDSRYLLLMDM